MITLTSVMSLDKDYWSVLQFDSTKTTGWRRPIGCLKLQVIIRQRATDYRALLRKMTYEDKASYDSTPPCTRLFEAYCRILSLLQGCFAKQPCNFRLLDSHSSSKCCGVAMISRLLKNMSLFCRISSFLQGSFAKETCNFRLLYLTRRRLRASSVLYYTVLEKIQHSSKTLARVTIHTHTHSIVQQLCSKHHFSRLLKTVGLFCRRALYKDFIL